MYIYIGERSGGRMYVYICVWIGLRGHTTWSWNVGFVAVALRELPSFSLWDLNLHNWGLWFGLVSTNFGKFLVQYGFGGMGW